MIASKKTIGVVVFLGGLVTASVTALADVPETLPVIGRQTPQQVQQNLERLGFTNVTDVVQSGRIFYAKATWEGQQVDIRVNTRTGAITDETAIASAAVAGRPTAITSVLNPHNAQRVASELENLGYEKVDIASSSGQIYHASATFGGNSYDLRIDVRTGFIADKGFTVEPGSGSNMPGRLTPNLKHSVPIITRQLQGAGFQEVANVQRSGRIYTASAVWDNESVLLRVNGETGIITER